MKDKMNRECEFVTSDEIQDEKAFQEKVKQAFEAAPPDVPYVEVDGITVPNRAFFE